MDQQQRSTTTITNKDFVPSPQLSGNDSPISSTDYARENVVPLNSFQKPTHSYDPQPFMPYPGFPSQQATQPSQRSPFDSNANYLPNYYNTPTGDNFAITNPWKIAPVSHDTGKWYWMPSGHQAPELVPTSTRAPSPSSNQIPPHWKWMFENKFNEIPTVGPDCCNGGDVYIRPSPSPEIQHSGHPYSFDPIDGNRFSQPTPRPFHTHHQNHQHNIFPGDSNGNGGEIGVFSTQVTESEYDHIVKGNLEEIVGTEMQKPKKPKG